MKKSKRDDRIIVLGRIVEILDDHKFTVSYKNKNMKEPFLINAKCGGKISHGESDALRVNDLVSCVLSENDLHKGIIIKTPYIL